MLRRTLLKLFTVSPLLRALNAGKVTDLAPAPSGKVVVTPVTLTDSEVLQFRKDEIRAFDVPKCKTMTLYANDENEGPIFFCADKEDPEAWGIKLAPGRQFVANKLPASKLYAVGHQDALLIVTFMN